MNTISDNDLILYFYRDGLETGRIAEIETALLDSADLRVRYDALQRMLGPVDAAPIPEADAQFTQRVWQRLAPRIESASIEPSVVARPKQGWMEQLHELLRSLLSPQFAFAATCMLAVAVGIGYYAGRSSATHESAVAENAMGSRILDAYVAEHLRATEGLLLTAVNSDNTGFGAGGSDLAATLADSNRLYAAAAARSGNTRLADFLRQLEPVLIDLANQPADAPVQSREGLRDYLRKTDLLFQVRATQARIDNTGKHRT